MAKQRGDENQSNERKLSALDRAVLQALGDGKVVGLSTDPAIERWPVLWQWLTKTEGGNMGEYILQPAIVTLQLGPEGVLVTLTHRDLRVTCSIACPHLDGALDSLEAAIASPNPPIKSWGKDLPNLKKRRPKT